MKLKKDNYTVRQKVLHGIDVGALILCILCFLVGSGVTIYVFHTYKKGAEEYESLSRYVSFRGEFSLNEEINTEMLANDGVDISDQLFNIDWDELYKINPEIVAWIYIPGTDVNYPIVQAMDNSKYLKLTYEGKQNACGAIFMNCFNRTNFSDFNTVIYGHNMRDGSMFATLNQYKEESFAKEHTEVWILTPKWERKYKVISAHETQDGSETYAIEFGEGMYESHVAAQVTQSVTDLGTGFDVSMPMVTLSTCTGRGKLTRMVLNCQPVYETVISAGA